MNERPLWAEGITIHDTKLVFGSGIANRIIDPQLAKKYKSYFDELTGCCRSGFPGSLAVSLMESDIPVLEGERYNIHLKSDGERYILFAGRDDAGKPFTDMFERSSSHYLVGLCFKQSVFDGTVLDGELVRVPGKEKYVFHVFDCMAYRGVCMSDKPYSTRLSHASTLISQCYSYRSGDPFQVVVKSTCSPSSCLEMLLADEGDRPFPMDGAVLVPEHQPYRWGRDQRLFKFKTKHTVDFYVTCEEESIRYHVIERGHHQFAGRFLPSPEDLEALGIGSVKLLHGCVVECEWDGKRNTWCPKKIRIDKDIPNNKTTLDRTMKNIVEDITPLRLYMSLVKGSKN